MMMVPRAPRLAPAATPFALDEVPEMDLLPMAQISLSGAPVLRPSADPVFDEPLPDLELPESAWSLDSKEAQEQLQEATVRLAPPAAPRLRPSKAPLIPSLGSLPSLELPPAAVSCSGAPCLRPCCNPVVVPALSPFTLPTCAFDICSHASARGGECSRSSRSSPRLSTKGYADATKAGISPRSSTILGDDRSDLGDAESLIFYLEEDEAGFDFVRSSSVEAETSVEDIFASGRTNVQDEALVPAEETRRSSDVGARAYSSSDVSIRSFILRKDFGIGPSKRLSGLSQCTTMAPSSVLSEAEEVEF